MVGGEVMATEGFENFQAVVTSLAAVGAVFVAWLGLSTWKTEARWNADSELARRVIVSIYKYRDSLYAVRHPSMGQREMEIDSTIAEAMTEDQKRRGGVIEAYMRRWEKHDVSRSEMGALLLEAESLWGKELSELVKPLKYL